MPLPLQLPAPTGADRVPRTLALTPIALSLMLWSTGASAQSTTSFKEQYKLIKAPGAVAAIGSDLFGDKVNMYTGGLEFVQTDVSLPGNNSLPVALGRRLLAGRHLFEDHPFSRWDIDLPYMHGVFAKGSLSLEGWKSSDGSGARCSNFGAPPETRGLNGSSIWTPSEFWQGNFMYVPGHGDQQLLRRALDNPTTPGAFSIDGVSVSSFPVVTSGKWAVGCLPSLANDASADKSLGQGFVAVSPDGTRYKFDWMVTYQARTLVKASDAPSPLASGSAEFSKTESESTASASGGELTPMGVITATLPMTEVRILPTKVIDRFGNTVTYTYDPARPANLKQIASSDGRVLTIAYVTDANGDTSRIKSVSDGSRTWNYEYNPDGFKDLVRVQQPDGTRWELGSITPLIADVQYQNDGSDYCSIHPLPFPTTLTGSMQHPSGATGTFTLKPTEHGRSDVQESCIDKRYLVPIFYFTNSLTSKTISGPGLSGLTWNYNYGAPNGSFSPCNGCVTTKTVDVTDPEGTVTRYTYGNRYFVSEGKLERIDSGWNGSSALRSVSIKYRDVGAGPYPVQDGTSDEMLGDGGTDLRNRPEEVRTTTQQNVDFVWRANAFDTLARPTNVTRSSTLGYARTESTTYEDNLAKWVIGQVRQVTDAGTGKLMVQNVYNSATATLTSVSEFGKLQRSMTYYADGTLQTVTDGKNQATTYSSYKRGIPQNIRYHDASSESAVVNNIGKITSLTNEAGFTTSFGYDVMGRLASVTYPTADTVAWTPATVSFWQSGSAHQDLAAGHWRQQVKVGNALTTTYYDALLRPVYTERSDIADPAATMRITRQTYDSSSRPSFTSYPKRSYAELGGGQTNEYDALGRPTTTTSTSELGSLVSSYFYNSGFETAHTDARGNTTYYRYQDFDEPSAASISNIALPEGVNVAIARDVFRKPTTITRSGAGKSVTRRYVYNAAELLCKTIEPETGATVQEYDAANNVLWRATGLTLTSPTSCDTSTASASTARKTSFGYDTRNRLTSTSFGDGSAGISRTYTPDSLPSTVVSGGTQWTYTYNKRRLMERESLVYGGSTYNIDRGYDANGSLAQVRYPVTNLTVTYNPNALGEARQVGSYASQITYHPNGAVAGFVYGNGIRRTLSQNARGLPLQSTDAGVLNESYTYDRNGNVDGITDLLSGLATRQMGYDGLDRLTSVSAPSLWGTAVYTYDAIDNLTGTSISGGQNARSTLHTINPTTNRLDSISNGPAAFNFAYGYDVQGNVTKRGAQLYRFDLANRMTQADGRATYLYDGHGRRTSSVGTDNVNKVQVYSNDGRLMYAVRTGATGTKYIYLNNHLIAEVN